MHPQRWLWPVRDGTAVRREHQVLPLLGDDRGLLHLRRILRLRPASQLPHVEPLPAGYACAFTCCGTVCVPPCGACDHFTSCCNEGASHFAGRPTDVVAARQVMADTTSRAGPSTWSRARLARTNRVTSRGPLRRPSLFVRRRKRTPPRAPISPVCGIDIVRRACANTASAIRRRFSRMASIDERVSRRRLLKRAGVGVAAVGAGSMLTAGPAFAAGACHDCACGPCDGQVPCQPTHHASGWCVPTTEGCCFCHEGSSCACLDDCTTSGDCPPGWACALSCCGGFLCLPPAGTQAICAGAVAGGPMSSGGGGHAAGGHHPDPEAPPDGRSRTCVARASRDGSC